MTQDICDVIIQVALGKESIKDVQYTKDLQPLKKQFQLTLLRGKEKICYIRAIANQLYVHGYVKLADGVNHQTKLKREDIVIVPNASIILS